jgi:hypothetical protein
VSTWLQGPNDTLGRRKPVAGKAKFILFRTGSEPTSRELDAGDSGRWDRISAENWPGLIVLSTVAVEIATIVKLAPPIRGPLVLWFSLVCNGMAWVRLLRIDDPLAEVVTAIALSVALSGLTAAAFLYAGHWSPEWSLIVLQAITLAGVILGRRFGRAA